MRLFLEGKIIFLLRLCSGGRSTRLRSNAAWGWRRRKGRVIIILKQHRVCLEVTTPAGDTEG